MTWPFRGLKKKKKGHVKQLPYAFFFLDNVEEELKIVWIQAAI